MSNKLNAEVIAIEDLIYSLGLLDNDVLSWIKRDNPNITLDHRARESVPKEFLEKYSKSDEYDEAFKRAVIAERFFLNLDTPEINRKLKEQRLKLLNAYEIYINELENIHQKYLPLANRAGHESSIMAAYLLFSRVISMLKMCCRCQRDDYWYWASLLRDFDESLALAEYFVIYGNTPAGKADLFKWFRQNNVPAHSTCRNAISKNMSSIDESFSESENYKLILEIYNKKSKFTHPTYLLIRGITKYNILPNGLPIVEKVEYGSCDYQRKHLEFTEFFKSHILSSFLTFLQCFGLSLAEEDLKVLRDTCQKLNDEETEDYLKRNC